MVNKTAISFLLSPILSLIKYLLMTPKGAADGLIYGFEKIGVRTNLVIQCSSYACEIILGQYAQINKDGTENEEWKFWLEAFNYLKEKQQ